MGTLPENLKIEYRDISTLVLNPANARTHSRAHVKLIAKSQRNFKWTNPIIVDGTGMILCGHGRYQAAILNGFERVPVIVLSDMSDADRRAYIIADNALAEKAGWNKQILKSELSGLIAIGYEVELSGLSTLEIDTILAIGDEPEVDEAQVEIPAPDVLPVTEQGDSWDIGDHRLVCGDARDAAVFEKVLGQERAELFFADPPFNVKIAGNVSGLGKHKHGEFLLGSGELSDGEFITQLLRPSLRNMARYGVAGAIAYVCMDWRNGRHLQDAADGVFAELKNLIVWVKTNASMGTFYRSQHELIYAYKVSRGKHVNNFGLGAGGRSRSNCWTYPGANTFRAGRNEDLADHPTVKPKKLVADAILDCSRPGSIVMDPFAGSGTTLVAAAMTRRRGFGIELDPKYCDVILRRMAAETGLPVMMNGRSFADIAAERGRA